jgi:competence protein ComEA
MIAKAEYLKRFKLAMAWQGEKMSRATIVDRSSVSCPSRFQPLICIGRTLPGCIVFFAAVASAWAQLPDGPGKDVTEQVCGKCHDAAVVAGYHQGSEAWTDTISKMIDQGAEGSDAQFAAILNYLVKNFGPENAKINVNKLGAKELAAQLEVTPKEADSIVKYRDENGAFKEVADLKKVPDLDYKKIEAKKDRLAF